MPETNTTTAPETTLHIDTVDVLERVVALGQEARAVEIHDLAAPVDAYGIPPTVPVLVKYGPTPTTSGLEAFFEPWRTAPKRRNGTASVTTLESFCNLVNRHKDAHSVIFAKTDWPAPHLLAVIDYHSTHGEARFGTHRISYAFPITKEFETWMKLDGGLMEQAEFAIFLEEHAKELAEATESEIVEYEPLFKERFAAPNRLIELSRDLEIYVGQRVKRQERIQTGERSVVFETEHKDANGQPVEIPGIFMVSVHAFVDGEAIRIPARLRYRVHGGEIRWGYQLYRPEFWLRERVKSDLVIAGEATGLPTFEGAPEV
jgi:uncharacterized protein YfdQ (DUF2303 family)